MSVDFFCTPLHPRCTLDTLQKMKGITSSANPLHFLRFFGAGKGTRTPDPRLGKPMLYQLSYARLVQTI